MSADKLCGAVIRLLLIMLLGRSRSIVGRRNEWRLRLEVGTRVERLLCMSRRITLRSKISGGLR